MESKIDLFIEQHKIYFDTALAEIKRGKKETHWMWFIFPQIKGLGKSAMANKYAINDLAEAKESLKMII